MPKKKTKTTSKNANPAAAVYMGVVVAGALVGVLGGTDFLHGVAVGIVGAGAIAMGWSIATQS